MKAYVKMKLIVEIVILSDSYEAAVLLSNALLLQLTF